MSIALTANGDLLVMPHNGAQQPQNTAQVMRYRPTGVPLNYRLIDTFEYDGNFTVALQIITLPHNQAGIVEKYGQRMVVLNV